MIIAFRPPVSAISGVPGRAFCAMVERMRALTIDDAKSADMDEVFRNVVHIHSDSRCAACSLFLAKEAKRRGISVSCDTEKDRKTKELDELIQLTDLLFTNSSCLHSYLERLDAQLEKERGRETLPKPVVSSKDTKDTQQRCGVHESFWEFLILRKENDVLRQVQY